MANTTLSIESIFGSISKSIKAFEDEIRVGTTARPNLSETQNSVQQFGNAIIQDISKDINTLMSKLTSALGNFNKLPPIYNKPNPLNSAFNIKPVVKPFQSPPVNQNVGHSPIITTKFPIDKIISSEVNTPNLSAILQKNLNNVREVMSGNINKNTSANIAKMAHPVIPFFDNTNGITLKKGVLP